MNRQTVGLKTVAALVLTVGCVVTARCQEPVIHWTFDGVATNGGSGGAALNATLSGSPAYAGGIAGPGLQLDGVDDFVSVPYQLPSQGTIALWFKPDYFFNYNCVFDNSVHADQWEMWLYSDARLRFRVTNASGDVTLDNLNNKLNGSNQWYHIALTWNNLDTKMVRLYVNGVERGSSAISTWIAPGANFYLGGGNVGNNRGKGVMDDVRVYDTALTAAQVQTVQAAVATQAPVVRVTLDGAVTNSGTGGPRYDAALSGEPAWTNGWNDKGQALALDGVDDTLSVPYRLSASGSIALWYYAQGPWYNYNSIFDNSVNSSDYECWIGLNGTLQFRPSASAFPQSVGYNLGSASNRWYHIVGTWDALSSNVVLYVNGVERSRIVNTNGMAWTTAGTNFFVGGGNAGNTKGRGQVYDLQLFETALPSDRVAEIYGEMSRRGGLLAYVPFDGTAVDVAGSNAVVLGGSPVYVKSQGGFLKGLNCRGVGTADYAAISNVLGSSVGTIALWYYARGPWYNYQTVLDNLVHADYWESWIYNDGRLAFRVSGLSGGGTVIYDKLDNLGGPDNWYHLAYVWDRAAQQTRLYVNGVQRGSATLTDAGWVAPDPTLCLAGVRNTKGNGIWDEVRVYDRALTAEELAELMVIPPPPPSRGTLIAVL